MAVEMRGLSASLDRSLFGIDEVGSGAPYSKLAGVADTVASMRAFGALKGGMSGEIPESVGLMEETSSSEGASCIGSDVDFEGIASVSMGISSSATATTIGEVAPLLTPGTGSAARDAAALSAFFSLGSVPTSNSAGWRRIGGFRAFSIKSCSFLCKGTRIS